MPDILQFFMLAFAGWVNTGWCDTRIRDALNEVGDETERTVKRIRSEHSFEPHAFHEILVDRSLRTCRSRSSLDAIRDRSPHREIGVDRFLAHHEVISLAGLVDPSDGRRRSRTNSR